MQSDDAPSGEVGEAIDHGVKAGACWTASRRQPHRRLWRYIGEAHSRRAGERLAVFVLRRRVRALRSGGKA